MNHLVHCQEINQAIKFAKVENNNISEISDDWSKVSQVVYMKENLTPLLKEKIISKILEIKYWEDPGSPHYPPSEGFLCEKCKVVISFPKKEKDRFGYW